MSYAGLEDVADVAADRLVWNLTLDKRNRPTAYSVTWRHPIEGATYVSQFSTTCSGWREGTISRPSESGR